MTSQLARKRILVVDDEPAFTHLLRLNLERERDCQVVEENDPRGALRSALACRPDLILLDVVMPGLDGGDVAALLRSDPATRCIPVLFVTALLEGAADACGDPRHYVPKPPGLEALIGSMEGLIGPIARPREMS